MLANSWLAASPPTAGFLAVSGGLGLAGCMALTVVDLVASDADAHQVHDVSGSFTSPEGLLLSSYGAITGGEQGFQDYAQIGALTADARGLLFDFVPSPEINQTAARELFDKISFVSDAYSLGHDVADYSNISPVSSDEIKSQDSLGSGTQDGRTDFSNQEENDQQDSGWSLDPTPIYYSNPPGDPDYRNSGYGPSDPDTGNAPIAPSYPAGPVYSGPEDPDDD